MGQLSCASEVGRAIEKAIAKHVDKYGELMTDRFDLYFVPDNNMYDLHYHYYDKATGAMMTKVFSSIPPRMVSGFNAKMEEVRAWLKLRGVLRNTSTLTVEDLQNAAACLDRQNVPKEGRVAWVTDEQLRGIVDDT